MGLKGFTKIGDNTIWLKKKTETYFNFYEQACAGTTFIKTAINS